MQKCLLLVLIAATASASAQIHPHTMPKTGTVDPRFQSYNIEMVEVIGGRFWRPYGSASVPEKPQGGGTPGGLDASLFEQRRPIDLTNPRLRKLALALGPAYVRVSGTWANTVYFQDSDAPAPAKPPAGFGGVLTRAEWKGVVAFSKAVHADIVTSFSTGAGTRDAEGVWTPEQAKSLLAYTRSAGGSIAAAEYMNEPTFTSGAGVPASYGAAEFGRDFAIFKRVLRASSPHTLILGPGSVGEGTKFIPMKLLASSELLKAMGPDAVDVFSYHFYGAVSERCSAAMGGAAGGTTSAAALSEDWLEHTSTVEAFYAKLRDEYEPGKPMWVTETGQTACGGDRWASTFLDSFRYLDQMGRLARAGVKVIMHNTLAASDYGLLDEKTLDPRPDYWAALLWHETMGTTVLNPSVAAPANVHLYAHCMAGRPGGVSLLALNLSRNDGAQIEVAEKAMRFTLSSTELLAHSVALNGTPLTLSPKGDVPALIGVAAAKGALTLPAASITVLTFADANNPACR